MQSQLDPPDFLKNACFIAAPSLKKVWCSFKNLTYLDKSEALKYTSSKQNFFYKNDFNGSDKKPWIKSDYFIQMNIDEFFEKIDSLPSEPPSIEWEDSKKERYDSFFYKSQNGIKNFNISKIVPFFQNIGQTTLNIPNLIYFLKNLSKIKNDKSLFFYGYWDFDNEEMQIGASPELLFLKNKHTIHTIALAGTSIYPQKEFRQKKLKNEHEYVMNDIYNELKQFGSVRKYRSQIVKFGNFFHKKTRFTVDCSNSTPEFESLLTSVFPSPAIGAYPRQNGLPFLNQIEHELNIKRGFFACPFGIQTSQNFMLCLAAIRGIEWRKDQFIITAGGGVIEESHLESEWKEIELKIASIKSIFGLI